MAINSKSQSLEKDFGIICIAYVLALIVAMSVGYAVRALHPLLIVFISDIAATLVIYSFGRIFRNASFYDPYWSVAPLAVALYWLIKASAGSPVAARQIIVVMLVYAWGARLTYNWARGWHGLKHEDWRYQDYRKKFRRVFWLIDLIGIEIMPTIIVFLACLSLYPVLSTGHRPFGALDVVAIIVTAGAITIETMADRQLKNFSRQRAPPRRNHGRGTLGLFQAPQLFWGNHFLVGAVYLWRGSRLRLLVDYRRPGSCNHPFYHRQRASDGKAQPGKKTGVR